MVKGISKRVIVVKTPVSGIFEQAVFFLGDNSPISSTIDAENILSEAYAVADDYVKTHCSVPRSHMHLIALTALLSCGITLLFCTLAYMFII